MPTQECGLYSELLQFDRLLQCLLMSGHKAWSELFAATAWQGYDARCYCSGYCLSAASYPLHLAGIFVYHFQCKVAVVLWTVNLAFGML